MIDSSSKLLHIAGQPEQAGLSASQQLFNRLVEEIETQRTVLASWQEGILLFQQKYAEEFVPQIKLFNGLRADFVHLLDQAYDEKIFDKLDKSKIKELICSMAEELIENHGDVSLKSILGKYRESDVADNAAPKFAENILALENGAPEFASPEDMMAHAEAAREAQMERDAQFREAQKAQHDKRKRSGKSRGQRVQMEQLLEEAKKISHSIRAVYRKLASALHPDKEQDSMERERKTVLMQRVNVAYDQKNLLELLELQLEVEQISQAGIDTMSEERLEYYNKVLTSQASELRREIADVTQSFSQNYQLSFGASSSPAKAMRSLESDIKTIKRDIVGLRNDVRACRDSQNIKSALKNQQLSV
ncbi:molecular chaperone DnaJ [Herbaspirillum sp. RTI4]|uniref:J domain-containing protein n=1 Tax=Herbaspirillum sp. RTI4 TaxID=3048640 RepID=UPI002AB3521A|nr:molecular chaperone DnaJ [Herbaspirillum sp. RTI4]MDY7578800.1 molecular chaperone DnaJ [Herbaspirillum sp. RTI4]MEA9982279.1 molecular chaperone DnaJ [Herbaspirillum sp. RTI4]